MKKWIAMLCALSLAAALSAPAVLAEGEENLALGATALVPSEKDGHAAAQGVDGDDTTSWIINGTAALQDHKFVDEVYFGVDFGAPKQFNKLEITFEADRPAASADGYRIEVSEDGKTWTEAKGANFTYAVFVNEFEEIGSTTDTITFAEPLQSQYVRVRFLKPTIDEKVSPGVLEFRVFNVAGGAVAPETPTTGVAFPPRSLRWRWPPQPAWVWRRRQKRRAELSGLKEAVRIKRAAF